MTAAVPGATMFSADVAARLDRAVARTRVVGVTTELPVPEGDPRFHVFAASNGDLTAVLDGVARSSGGASTRGTIDGAGGSVRSAQARLLSIAEAIERYSSCSYDDRQFLWATAAELGDDAVNLQTLPLLSDAEVAPGPWVRPDPSARIRWVKAVRLGDDRVCWIPAVLAYLHLPFEAPAEQFTLPISTGCAIHEDPLAAILSGLLEVVERDAIALTWLQRLRWPRLDRERLADPGRLERALRDDPNSTLHLFDATTDVGVPTVYGVDVCPWNERTRTVVAAVTSTSFDAAVEKIVREALACRIALQSRRPSRTDPDTFVDVHDGALHMAQGSRAEAFDFLLDGAGPRGPVQPLLPLDQARGTAGALRLVLDRLAAMGMEAYAVDLSSREVRELGLFCAKVIVPGLMPLSFAPRAQFRGSARLYDAPAAMGYRVRLEADLNPWPQPFA